MKQDYSLFRRKGQKVWYFHYYQGSRRKTRSTGKVKKYEVEQEARKFLNRDPDKDVTLREYARDFYQWDTCRWIQRQQAKGRSFSRPQARNRRSHLEMYLFPAFVYRRLGEINAIEFENWIITLPLANGTKNSILHSLNIIMKEARRERLIDYNPISEVEPLANRYRRRDILSPAEIKALFPEDREGLLKVWESVYYAALFGLMLGTWIRVGEARALQCNDVVWDRKGLLVLRAIKADDTIGLPKNNEQRSVLIPEQPLKILRWWKAETIRGGDRDYIFHSLDEKYADKPLDRKTVHKHFNMGLQAAGIATEGRNLVTHSLRHTYNTMMRSVIPEAVLHYMIGHKSRLMTDRYDQATPEQKLREFLPALEEINKAWE